VHARSATIMRWRLGFGLAVVVLFLATNSGSAGLLDASWMSPTTNVDGSQLTDLASYRVYHGTGNAPCPGPSFFQVTSSTSSPPANQIVTLRLTGLASGTRYFASVTAVNSDGDESPCSPAASAVARSSFSVSPSGSLNFGSVNVGAFASQTLTVHNTAGGTVSGTVSVPAPFSVVSGSPFNLVGLNATQVVTVRFRPTTTATATANVTITADGDTMSRNVSGNGTGGALTLTSLTANPAAPRPPGSTVTVTAGATGGTAPYQFKWLLWDGATWTAVRNWSASNTFVWTPSTSNPNYRVGIWVRSAGETADQPSGYPTNTGAANSILFPIQGPVLKLTSLTANLAAPRPPSSTVTVTAAATGGTAPYQFKWLLWNGATWTAVRNWSTSNTFTWTPSTPNPNYRVGVWVRSAGETADQPSGYPTYIGAANSILFPIQGPILTLTSLTANLGAPQSSGSTVTLTAGATGGTAPYQFKWLLWNGATWTAVSNWSTSNTFVWTPSTPNPNYRVGVWVRSAGETADQPSGYPTSIGAANSILFPIN
jgi:ASPM-SPD-2-Hydin domain-containing protein